MHISGRGLADVVPAEADNIFCEQPIAAAKPLVAGVRSERDVYHEHLLAGLALRHDNFSYQIILSEPGSESRQRRGLLHQALAEDLADAAGYTAYLAGPPAMVEATGDLLLSRGIAPCDIHADAFRYQPLGRRAGMP